MFHIDLKAPTVDLRLIRLFPHGGAFLLLDSLIINHPAQVVRILRWFRVFILANKPPWQHKFVTRPRLRDWILSIIECRPGEDGKVFVELYEQILRLLPLELMDENDDFETGKDGSSLVSSSFIPGYDTSVGLGHGTNTNREDVADNDNKLVEWFAGWTRTKVESLRRFQIVHGDAQSLEEVKRRWGKQWNYV